MNSDERAQPEQSPASPACDQLAASALFGLAFALGGLLSVALLRATLGLEGFEIPASAYLRAGGLAAALLLASHVVRSKGALWAFLSFLAPLAAMSLLAGPALYAVDLMVASVLLIGGLQFLRTLATLPRLRLAAFGALGLGCSVLVLNVVLAAHYATPLTLEMSLVGATHRDVLFNAAIAQMIANYGVPSIGADGLVPIGYHVLSHRMIAGFSAWTGIEVLTGYGIFVLAVGIPVLLGLLAQVAVALGNGDNDSPAAPLIPLAVLTFGGAAMWHSYYLSETYLVSLWFLLWAAWLVRDALVRPHGMHRIALFAAIFGAILLAALAKISVGAVLASSVAVGLAAGWRFRPVGLMLGVLIGVAPFLAAFFAVPIGQASEDGMFRFFGFFEHSEPAIYALLFAGIVSVASIRRFPTEPPRRALVLMLLAGMWAGVVSSNLVNLAGGSEFYFSDPGTWLGLLLIPVLGLAPRWFSRRSPARQTLVVFLAIPILLALHEPKLRSLDWIEQASVELRTLEQDGAPSGFAAITAEVIAARRAEDLSFDGIMVDPGFTDFWALHNICWANTFLLPAVLGQPMLRGLPPDSKNCSLTPNYGLVDYDWDESRAGSDTDTCALARARQMRHVLVVSADSYRVIACGLETGTD